MNQSRSTGYHHEKEYKATNHFIDILGQLGDAANAAVKTIKVDYVHEVTHQSLNHTEHTVATTDGIGMAMIGAGVPNGYRIEMTNVKHEDSSNLYTVKAVADKTTDVLKQL